jgi:hypothetical protein
VPAAFTGIDGSVATEVELSAIEAPPTFTLTTVAPAQTASAAHQGLLPGIGSAIVGGTGKVGSVVVDGLATAAGAVGGVVGGAVGAVGAGAKKLFHGLGLF